MPPKNEGKHFIKEKIKDKPLNKKKVLHKGIATIGYAVLFGFVSCLVFCVLRPIMEPWFAPEQDQWIGIPKDTRADDESQTDDTVADTEPQPDQEKENTDKKKKEKQTVYVTEKKSMTLDDYQVLQNQLYRIGNQVNKSIVTVTGVKEVNNIFDSPYEAAGQASGLIIGSSSKELLILTEYSVIEDVKSIRVTFLKDDTLEAELKKYDGNTGLTLDAKLKKYDGNTGIAVLGVPLENISEEVMNHIEIAVLGNSLNLRQGKMVVALGSPLGTNYSILTGNITSVSNTISTADFDYTVFTTNIVSNTKGNGVLINTDGEVIGLFLKSSNIQKEQNTLTAVSISELKDIIELLSNGVNIPYIGIKGKTVTDDISQEYEIPKGVYIKEAVVNSPAMTAGIQTGDVIEAIDGKKIYTMEDYQKTLLSLQRGDEVKITVNRQGTKEYKKYNCVVEVGVLK